MFKIVLELTWIELMYIRYNLFNDVDYSVISCEEHDEAYDSLSRKIKKLGGIGNKKQRLDPDAVWDAIVSSSGKGG